MMLNVFMSGKIKLGIENIFDKDVLLPFSQRRRIGVGGRSGVGHSNLSTRMFNALASYGMKELLIAGGGDTARKAIVTASYLIVEEYGISGIDLTINIETSGKNGLDSGTVAANTWYSIWIIYDEKTEEVAGLFSTAQVNPQLPVGFTQKRRVGWVRTDLSVYFYPRFDQRNNKVFFHDMLSTGAYDATVWTDVNCSTLVPKTTGQAFALLTLRKGTPADGAINIRPNGSTSDGWQIGHVGYDGEASRISSVGVILPMDSSQIFEYFLKLSGNTTSIQIFGYEDQF